ALWVGVRVPNLSVLPGSGADGGRNVSIALESALLRNDDGSGRRIVVGALADRIGLPSSRSLLPSLERLRAAAGGLPSHVGTLGVASNRERTLAVEIREQLLAEAAAASHAPSAPAASDPGPGAQVPAAASP